MVVGSGGGSRRSSRTKLPKDDGTTLGENTAEVAPEDDTIMLGENITEDAPEGSAAHTACRWQQLGHRVSFLFEPTDGEPVHFYTTQCEAGSREAAERISRLCYARFEAGYSKEQVLEYRGQLYKRCAHPESPSGATTALESASRSSAPSTLAKRHRSSRDQNKESTNRDSQSRLFRAVWTKRSSAGAVGNRQVVSYEYVEGTVHNAFPDSEAYQTEAEVQVACNADSQCKGYYHRSNGDFRKLAPGDYTIAAGVPNVVWAKAKIEAMNEVTIDTRKTKQQQEKAGADLKGLKLGPLKRKAKDEQISEAEIDRTIDDADDPLQALMELIVNVRGAKETRRGSSAPAAKITRRGSSAPAAKIPRRGTSAPAAKITLRRSSAPAAKIESKGRRRARSGSGSTQQQNPSLNVSKAAALASAPSVSAKDDEPLSATRRSADIGSKDSSAPTALPKRKGRRCARSRSEPKENVASNGKEIALSGVAPALVGDDHVVPSGPATEHFDAEIHGGSSPQEPLQGPKRRRYSRRPSSEARGSTGVEGMSSKITAKQNANVQDPEGDETKEKATTSPRPKVRSHSRASRAASPSPIVTGTASGAAAEKTSAQKLEGNMSAARKTTQEKSPPTKLTPQKASHRARNRFGVVKQTAPPLGSERPEEEQHVKQIAFSQDNQNDDTSQEPLIARLQRSLSGDVARLHNRGSGDVLDASLSNGEHGRVSGDIAAVRRGNSLRSVSLPSPVLKPKGGVVAEFDGQDLASNGAQSAPKSHVLKSHSDAADEQEALPTNCKSDLDLPSSGAAEAQNENQCRGRTRKAFVAGFRVPGVARRLRVKSRELTSKSVSNSTLDFTTIEENSHDRVSAEDAPVNSEAYTKVEWQGKYQRATFEYEDNAGPIKFTTTKARAGNRSEAERISRLCYARFEAGFSKDDVLAYRDNLCLQSTSGNSGDSQYDSTDKAIRGSTGDCHGDVVRNGPEHPQTKTSSQTNVLATLMGKGAKSKLVPEMHAAPLQTQTSGVHEVLITDEAQEPSTAAPAQSSSKVPCETPSPLGSNLGLNRFFSAKPGACTWSNVLPSPVRAPLAMRDMPHSLLAERHAPTRAYHMDVQWYRNLASWLSRWRSDPNSNELAALVMGPPGVGKTVGSRLAARCLDAAEGKPCIAEYDLGDNVGRAVIDDLAKGYSIDLKKCTAAVIDIDCTSKAAKAVLYKALKKSPCPIILVSNEVSAPVDENLEKCCLHVKAVPVSVKRVVKILQNIVKRERFKLSSETIEALAESCGGDVRRAIGTVQLFSKSRAGAQGPEARTLHSVTTPLATCRLLLAPAILTSDDKVDARFSLSVATRQELLVGDAEQVKNLVQERYLYACASGLDPNQNLEACAAAAADIALGDAAASSAILAAGNSGAADCGDPGYLLSAVLPSGRVALSRAVSAVNTEETSDMISMPDDLEVPSAPDPILPGTIARLGRDLGFPREFAWAEFLKWRSLSKHRTHAELWRIRRDFGSYLQRVALATSIKSKSLSPLQKLEDALQKFSILRMDSSVSDVAAAAEAHEDAEVRRSMALEAKKLQCENLAMNFQTFGLDNALVLAFPSALMPPPSERSELQDQVLDQFEKEANRVMILMREKERMQAEQAPSPYDAESIAPATIAVPPRVGPEAAEPEAEVPSKASPPCDAESIALPSVAVPLGVGPEAAEPEAEVPSEAFQD